jgi:inositol transport system permease protein
MTSPSSERLDRIAWIGRVWTWLFLIALLAFFEVWSQLRVGRTFLASSYNLQAILLAASAPLLLAIGQTFVIITAGIDLSVGFVMGLAAVIAARLAAAVGDSAWALPVAAGATLLICLVPGWINGLLIARLGVPAFIGTLGMYGVARGAGFLAAGSGMTISVPHTRLDWLGTGWTPIWLTGLLLAFMHLVLSTTRFGQYTYAIGGNAQSARRAGIDVSRHLTAVYMLSAAFAAAGGVVYTARYGAGAANAGESMLLDSIAAVVIGGASLFGGTGTLIGTLIGALIIAVINFGLIFIDVDAFWQFIAVGVVIILSVLVDQYKARLGVGA